jgi:hypothetical protein
LEAEQRSKSNLKVLVKQQERNLQKNDSKRRKIRELKEQTRVKGHELSGLMLEIEKTINLNISTTYLNEENAKYSKNAPQFSELDRLMITKMSDTEDKKAALKDINSEFKILLQSKK